MTSTIVEVTNFARGSLIVREVGRDRFVHRVREHLRFRVACRRREMLEACAECLELAERIPSQRIFRHELLHMLRG